MATTMASQLRFDPNARYEVKIRDLEYRKDGSRSWLARVYEPQGAGPFPALVDIHGGGWERFDRTRDEPYIGDLAAHGMFIFSPDFHQSDEAPYPASMQDINYATRWMKAHAAEFHAIPDGVGGSGFSSGGHLVALSAMRPRDPRYTAHRLTEAPDVDAKLSWLLLGWPAIDSHGRYVSAMARGDKEAAKTHTKYFLDEATMKEASPLLMLERGEKVELPAALHLQGSADLSHPREQADRFIDAYSKAGGHIEGGRYPGATSAFIRAGDENSRRAIGQIRDFVTRQIAELARDR